MKVLFLISQLPYPPDTGAKARSYNLIRELSSRHEIYLITFGDPRKEKVKIRDMEKYCRQVEVVTHLDYSSFAKKYTSLFVNLFSPFPYTVKKYYSARMEERISSLIKREGFGLIHCDSLQVSLNLLNISPPPDKLLTEHNVESIILKRYYEKEGNFLKKMYVYLQWRKLKRYEESACQKFKGCVAVSDEDKRILEKMSSRNDIAVVSNGVDCSYFIPSTEKIKNNGLVFTGSMDWLPNEDAMLYFISEIYPRIKFDIPEVCLTIAGKNPSQTLLNLGKRDDSINVTGIVEDIRPYIAQAALCIVPLRIGSGTRLKIMEAMAMGKPIVSTSIGSEGIGVNPGRDIILADDPVKFAQKVVELLRDPSLCRRLGKAGKRLAEERYDWKSIAGNLDQVWKNVAKDD